MQRTLHIPRRASTRVRAWAMPLNEKSEKLPIIFKHAPLVEARFSVGFLNSLRVADDRGSFYEMVKAEFPSIVIPQQSNMQYDFGDYHLFASNLTDHLEIG